MENKQNKTNKYFASLVSEEILEDKRFYEEDKNFCQEYLNKHSDSLIKKIYGNNSSISKNDSIQMEEMFHQIIIFEKDLIAQVRKMYVDLRNKWNYCNINFLKISSKYNLTSEQRDSIITDLSDTRKFVQKRITRENENLERVAKATNPQQIAKKSLVRQGYVDKINEAESLITISTKPVSLNEILNNCKVANMALNEIINVIKEWNSYSTPQRIVVLSEQLLNSQEDLLEYNVFTSHVIKFVSKQTNNLTKNKNLDNIQ